jgi:hypothetical protein
MKVHFKARMSAFMLEMNRETAGSYLDTEEGTLIQ